MPKRIPKRRDPNWFLPESPTSDVYEEILAHVAEGNQDLFAEVALNDYWFFVRHVSTLGQVLFEDPDLEEWYGKPWLDHPYFFNTCREMQNEPYGYLDLEARFHLKTALRTQYHALWEAADDENLRQLIITNKIDKTGEAFLSQPKRECEINPLLFGLFPWTFFENPEKESARWTNTELVFRTSTNAREPSLAVASLGAGVTSWHVHIKRWDDLVTEKSVESKDAIEKTTQQWRNFAGTKGEKTYEMYTGTHWAVNDTYRTILDSNIVKLRRKDIYREDGETPQVWSLKWIEDIRDQLGSYGFAAQCRNDPVSAGRQTFQPEWLCYDDLDPEDRAKKLNVYIFAETATGKRGAGKKLGAMGDYTVIWVIGYGLGVPEGRYYVLDLVRDRMGLVRFGEVFFEKLLKWKPRYSFLEQVGKMSDAEYLRAVGKEKGIDFRLIEVHEVTPKETRISRLQPLFEKKRITLPRSLSGWTDGRPRNLIEDFKKDEYLPWNPAQGSTHDDMLDALAWIASPETKRLATFPGHVGQAANDVFKERRTGRRRRGEKRSVWAI